mgnify:CR=1 FL=1
MPRESTIEEPHTEAHVEESPRPERKMHPEIAELEEPIQKLLEQLRERIDRGDYQLIIGDDASGRIPARIMHQALQEIYKEKGLKEPDIRFFAGSGGSDIRPSYEDCDKKTHDIAEYLSRYAAGLPTYKDAPQKASFPEKTMRRALIVTDTIVTGDSLVPIVNALKNNGIAYDIAAIGRYGYTRQDEKLLGSPENKIFHAQSHVPAIDQARHISGVYKRTEDVFSRKITTPKYEGPERKREVQQIINEAREDAKKIADELVEWYQKTVKHE